MDEEDADAFEEGVGGVEGEEACGAGAEEAFGVVDDGVEPEADAEEDGDHVPDVTEEDVEGAQAHADACGEGDEEEEGCREEGPSPGGLDAEGEGDGDEEGETDGEPEEGGEGALGDEDVFGEGEFAEVVGVGGEGVGGVGDALAEGGPGEECGAEVDDVGDIEGQAGAAFGHDASEDDGEDEDEGEGFKDVPDEAHHGARVAIADFGEGVAPDVAAVGEEGSEHGVASGRGSLG